MSAFGGKPDIPAKVGHGRVLAGGCFGGGKQGGLPFAHKPFRKWLSFSSASISVEIKELSERSSALAMATAIRFTLGRTLIMIVSVRNSPFFGFLGFILVPLHAFVLHCDSKAGRGPLGGLH